jgi:hypothetical protein
MLTEDYFMRMISQAIAVLMNVLRLKKGGQFQEAHQVIEGALEGLLGLHPNLARHLEDNRLLEIMTVQEKLDIDRLAVIADLYQQDGEVLAQLHKPEESAEASARALRFHLEIALADRENIAPEQIEKIESLTQAIIDQAWPLETQLARLDYLESLLGKHDRLLAAGRLTKDQVKRMYAELREKLEP